MVKVTIEDYKNICQIPDCDMQSICHKNGVVNYKKVAQCMGNLNRMLNKLTC